MDSAAAEREKQVLGGSRFVFWLRVFAGGRPPRTPALTERHSHSRFTPQQTQDWKEKQQNWSLWAFRSRGGEEVGEEQGRSRWRKWERSERKSWGRAGEE